MTKWTEDLDGALRQAVARLEMIGLHRRTALWQAVAGVLAAGEGVVVSPAACSSRYYRLVRPAKLAEFLDSTEAEPSPDEDPGDARAREMADDAAAPPEDGWQRASRLADEYEADALDRIEATASATQDAVLALREDVAALRREAAALRRLWE